jgi:hypothetical protein
VTRPPGPRTLTLQFVPVQTARRLLLVLAVTLTLAGAVASGVLVQPQVTSSGAHHGTIGVDRSSPINTKLCGTGQRCAPSPPSNGSGSVSWPGALTFLGAVVVMVVTGRRRRRAAGTRVHVGAFPSGVFRPPIASLA